MGPFECEVLCVEKMRHDIDSAEQIEADSLGSLVWWPHLAC